MFTNTEVVLLALFLWYVVREFILRGVNLAALRCHATISGKRGDTIIFSMVWGRLQVTRREDDPKNPLIITKFVSSKPLFFLFMNFTDFEILDTSKYATTIEEGLALRVLAKARAAGGAAAEEIVRGQL